MDKLPRPRSEPARLLAYVFLGVGALVTLYPLYWMVTAATLEESEVFKSPPRFLPGANFLQNLELLAQSAPFVRALLNSIFVASVTTASTDRKSTRLNSSHANISYAVFCLKK